MMMSDKPIKFEERMFDHVKVDKNKPTIPFEDCFQQEEQVLETFCLQVVD